MRWRTKPLTATASEFLMSTLWAIKSRVYLDSGPEAQSPTLGAAPGRLTPR